MADRATTNSADITMVSVPENISYKQGGSLTDLLEANLPDVAIVDSIAAGAILPLLGERRFHVAASIHQPPGGVPTDSSRLALDLHSYTRMELLIVASESLATEFRRSGLKSPIKVIPPGRDVEHSEEYFDDSARQRARVSMRRGRDASFLCVANWFPHKGILELLDAMSLIPSDSITLHLAGDTATDRSYSVAVKQRIRVLGLSETVEVHDIVPPEELAALYGGSDVFVAPSFQDAYATAVGEAMNMALPVIGWTAGNLPFLADDGVEGRVLQTGDIPALASAMLELASDESLRLRLGEAAQRRAQSRPTWDQSAGEFFRALRELSE